MKAPICADCGTSLVYKCIENEVVILSGNMHPKGDLRTFNTFNFGDLYKCPKCGALTATGFGTKIEGEFKIKEKIE